MFKLYSKLKLVVFLISLILVLLVFKSEIKAQNVNGSVADGTITVSPAISYVKANDEFKLIIENTTNSPFLYQITVSSFNLNVEERSVQRKANIEDFSKLFEIEDQNLNGVIDSGQQKIIPVKYTGVPSDLIPALIISQVSDKSNNVGISAEFASLVVDTTLVGEDRGLIKDDLSINPSSTLLGINFSNDYKIESEFKNETNKLVKISGEITVKDEDSYLANYAMSQYLLEPLFPGDSKNFKYNFSDNRNFLERFGNTTFTQTYIVNGESYIIEYTVFSVPTELAAIVFGVSVITIVWISYRARKRDKLEQLTGKKTEEVLQGSQIESN
ncbi:hypothetical protein KC669_01005 [Candidatus Dojkabacteria bacterium]|uniref:DUF916 domain-containing protein n=1 Tax=Candidatus Dojkabacteria bacterium TaxID=2099670 RepID=A0A955RLD5_9BACT|nr:hypothetical protein [Candidatus Dojkabacteria bacterium]